MEKITVKESTVLGTNITKERDDFYKVHFGDSKKGDAVKVYVSIKDEEGVNFLKVDAKCGCTGQSVNDISPVEAIAEISYNNNNILGAFEKTTYIIYKNDNKKEIKRRLNITGNII